jgi:predicted transcriptional regulator
VRVIQTVSLDVELAIRLREQAARENKSLSHLARNALAHYLDNAVSEA